MKIVVGVPDTVVRSVKLGQPVDVAIDAFPDRTFHARISRMASAADTITRNFEVEVAIPNRDHLLKVGMIGSLQLANADGAKRSVRAAGSAFGHRASEGRQIRRVRRLRTRVQAKWLASTASRSARSMAPKSAWSVGCERETDHHHRRQSA